MPQIVYAVAGPGATPAPLGRDLYNKVLPVRDAIDKADKVLVEEGLKVTKACFVGSAEDLAKPSIGGPAALALAYGTVAAIKAKRIQPQFVMGYGWAEAIGLACLGAIPYEEALRFMRKRGLILEEAWAKAPYHVASLVGIEMEELRRKLEPLPKKPLIICEDSQDACVLAGDEALLKRLMPLLANKREIKAGPIVPGQGWPHPSMEEAGKAVAGAFAAFKAERAGWDLFSCSALAPGRVSDWGRLAEIQGALCYLPWHWGAASAALRASGMDTLVEIGQSEALGAFTRRGDPGIRALATLDAKALSTTLKLAP